MALIMLVMIFLFSLNLVSALDAISTFKWEFADPMQQISSKLTSCSTSQLKISSLNESDPSQMGSPPYFLMILDESTESMTIPLGSDPNNLTWTVQHAPGSQVLISLADSAGMSGGMSANVLNVVGSDTSCIPQLPATDLKITSSLKSNLQTCGTWSLDVSGGTPPYQVLIAAVGAPTVFNYTIPSGYDHLDFISTVYPNSQVLAAVTDSTGVWGTSTGLVNTVGSTNKTCPGLGTTYSARVAPSHTISPAIIGVSVTLGIIGVISLVVITWILWRRRMRNSLRARPLDVESRPAFLPAAVNISAKEYKARTGEPPAIVIPPPILSEDGVRTPDTVSPTFSTMPRKAPRPPVGRAGVRSAATFSIGSEVPPPYRL